MSSDWWKTWRARRRVYLKLDTQGTDLDVVEGASGALEAVDALQSEVAVRPIYEGVPELAQSLARNSHGSASNRVACLRTTRAIFRGCLELDTHFVARAPLCRHRRAGGTETQPSLRRRAPHPV